MCAAYQVKSAVLWLCLFGISSGAHFSPQNPEKTRAASFVTFHTPIASCTFNASGQVVRASPPVSEEEVTLLEEAFRPCLCNEKSFQTCGKLKTQIANSLRARLSPREIRGYGSMSSTGEKQSPGSPRPSISDSREERIFSKNSCPPLLPCLKAAADECVESGTLASLLGIVGATSSFLVLGHYWHMAYTTALQTTNIICAYYVGIPVSCGLACTGCCHASEGMLLDQNNRTPEVNALVLDLLLQYDAGECKDLSQVVRMKRTLPTEISAHIDTYVKTQEVIRSIVLRRRMSKLQQRLIHNWAMEEQRKDEKPADEVTPLLRKAKRT